MSIDEMIDKARTAMKLMYEISTETGIYIDSTVAETHENSGEYTESFRMGDYVFHYDELYGLLINYMPLHRNAFNPDKDPTESWQYSVDPDRIISFTIPPKEKASRMAKGRGAKSKHPLELYIEPEVSSNAK